MFEVKSKHSKVQRKKDGLFGCLSVIGWVSWKHFLRWSLGYKLVITSVRGRGRKQNWAKEEVELQCRLGKGEFWSKDCLPELSHVRLKNAQPLYPLCVGCAGKDMTWDKAAPMELTAGCCLLTTLISAAGNKSFLEEEIRCRS